VAGVDISDRFIDEGRRRANGGGADIRFLHGDMRDLRFDAEFDAAVNYWGSFGYFDDDGDRRFASGEPFGLGDWLTLVATKVA